MVERWREGGSKGEGERERGREGGREREKWVDLVILMTPVVLVMTFSVMYDYTVANSMVQRGTKETLRVREMERLVDLGCLMTPSLSMDIRCHV